MSNVELLDRRVASAFYGRFTALKPAQEATIQPLLSGLNIVLSSGTGSGKTEAVVAPLISRHWSEAAETDGLTILYVAPTKALVNDLEKRLHPPLADLGLRVGIRHGDRDDLSSGRIPHVAITTPESLEVLLFRKEPSLKTIRAIVIDEVHLLYNTQRGLQVSILLKRLGQELEKPLQWAVLSATIARLPNVRDFLFGPTEDAVFLDYPHSRTIDAQIRHVPSEAEFLNLVLTVTQGQPTKLLVFANSRRECERLAGALQRQERLRPAIFAHYSSLSPELRVDAERKFSTLATAVCIATSTLELGIDIGDIDAIVLWGAPSGVESFLQRIGRGNRRSSKTNVVGLVPDNSTNVVLDAMRFLSLIDAAQKGEMPLRSPYELFGAIGQQCLSFIASDGGRFTRVADLCALMRHQNHLDRKTVEGILTALADNGYLQRHGFKNQYGAATKLHMLVDYRMIYGNFGAGSQNVEVLYRSKSLGEVPATNLLRLARGDFVRFAGKRWHVAKASPDGIFLEPGHERGGTAVDFLYPRGGIGSDSFVTDRMWRLIHGATVTMEPLSPSLRGSLGKAIERIRSVCRIDQIPFLRVAEGVSYLTFAGQLVNRAIALITRQPHYEADDVSLTVSSPIDWLTVPTDPRAYQRIFHQLFDVSADQSVYQALLTRELQLREFVEQWVKEQTVSDILIRLSASSAVQIRPEVLYEWLAPRRAP